MLFDIGWPELMLIGAVALVVIGPKDLPAALRVAGFWVRKARNLSREFQSSVEQMMREAELHEMQQQLKKATDIDLDHEIKKAIDPTGELAEALKPPNAPDYFDPAPSGSALPPPDAMPAETPAIIEPTAPGEVMIEPVAADRLETIEPEKPSASESAPARRKPEPSKT